MLGGFVPSSPPPVPPKNTEKALTGSDWATGASCTGWHYKISPDQLDCDSVHPATSILGNQFFQAQATLQSSCRKGSSYFATCALNTHRLSHLPCQKPPRQGNDRDRASQIPPSGWSEDFACNVSYAHSNSSFKETVRKYLQRIDLPVWKGAFQISRS